MGFITEREPQGEMLFNSKEQDLLSILTSKTPLDELDLRAKPYHFHIKKEMYDRLLLQLRSPNEDVQKEVFLELTWYCLPTVNAVVQKYRNMGISDADILQHALLTTQKAILEDFNEPQSRIDLKQKVHRSANQEIKAQLVEMYQIKHKDVGLLFTYFEARKIYFDETGREANDRELSQLFIIIKENNPELFPEETTLESSEVNDHSRRTLAHIHDIHSTQSQGSELLDMVVDNKNPEQLVGDQNILRDELSQALENELNPREQSVLRQRYYEGSSFKEASTKHGVTKERIRQIEAQALSKLRHPAIRRRLRPYLDNVPRATPKEVFPITADILPDELKEPKIIRRVAKEYTTGESPPKPEPERVEQAQDIKIEKSELPKDYWLDYHFRRYTNGVALGKKEVLAPGNYPKKIEISPVWHDSLNSIRSSAIKSELEWVFVGCEKGVNQAHVVTGKLRRNPERMGALEFLQEMSKAFESEKLFHKIGDVQTAIRRRNLIKLFGFEIGSLIEHEQPSLSPIHLYRFLADKDRPVLSSKVDGDNNIFVFRTSDTINLNPNDRYITQEVFVSHWYRTFGYRQITPNSWVPQLGRERKGWQINKEIVKSHNLVLYLGSPDKPLTKVK